MCKSAGERLPGRLGRGVPRLQWGIVRGGGGGVGLMRRRRWGGSK